MKIAISCDHNGIEKKQEIINNLKNRYEIIELGPKKYDINDDYPDFAFELGRLIRDKKIDFGLVLCGSGIGISIACNKVKNVRCAKVNTVKEAYLTRNDNDANVIAISSSMSKDKTKKVIDTFITTPFSNIERYIRRRDKINNYKEEK